MTIIQREIDKDNKYGAHNYKPLPIVIQKGKGEYLSENKAKNLFL